jgi:hypothetical protein
MADASTDETLSGFDNFALSLNAVQAQMNGRDGFLEAIQTADKMVGAKKEKVVKEQTAGFLQATLGGMDPGEALKRFPKTDEKQVQGFLQQYQQQQRDQATRKATASEWDRQHGIDQADAIAAEGRAAANRSKEAIDVDRRKLDLEEAKRKAEDAANDAKAQDRATVGGIAQRDAAAAPPAGSGAVMPQGVVAGGDRSWSPASPQTTSIIPHAQAGFLSAAGVTPKATAQDVTTRRDMGPGFFSTAEEVRARDLETRKKEADIQKAGTDSETKRQTTAFMAEYSANGNKYTPEMIAKYPLAATAVGATVAREDTQDFQAKQQAARLESAKTLVGERAKAQGIVLTPESTQMLAENYLATGTLPPLGMGTAAAQARTQIYNKASESGKTGGEIATQGAIYKATSAALKGDLKTYDGMQASHERIAAGFTILRNASAAAPRFGSMLANKPWEWIQKQAFSDPAMTNYKAALEIVLPEYAKLMSGNGMSQALQVEQLHHAQQILSSAMSDEQLNSALDTLESEMQGTLAAITKTVGQRTSNIGSSTFKTSSPVSAPKEGDLYDGVDPKTGQTVKAKFIGGKWIRVQ